MEHQRDELGLDLGCPGWHRANLQGEVHSRQASTITRIIGVGRGPLLATGSDKVGIRAKREPLHPFDSTQDRLFRRAADDLALTVVTAPYSLTSPPLQPLGWLQVSVSVLQYGCGGFERLLFGFIEAKFDYGLDTAATYDAGGAECDVPEAILAGHEC
jgi:hypothetical protein